MKGYFQLLPIGGFISYGGDTLVVRAIWCGGVVCKDSAGEVVCIEGATALNSIERI